MNMIAIENRKILALERAKQANNFIDCDVIQEAIGELEKAKTPTEIIEAMEYLCTAVEFKGSKSTRIINEYLHEIKSFALV